MSDQASLATGQSGPATPTGSWTILPRQRSAGARMAEVWSNRGLLGFFAQNALAKMYRRTMLGRAWLVIRPAMMVLPQVIFFTFIMNIEETGTPYLLFIVAGMLCWIGFEQTWLWVTRSLELNRKLLGKLYFPRLLLPFAFIAPALVDAAVIGSLLGVVLICLSVLDGVSYLNLSWTLPYAVTGFAFSILCGFSLGLWTAVWGSYYRDVRFTLRYVTMFLFFLTPVAYPPEMLPAQLAWLVIVNPMAQAVLMFRGGLIATPYDPGNLIVALTIIGIVLIGGVWYFLKNEAVAVDRM